MRVCIIAARCRESHIDMGEIKPFLADAESLLVWIVEIDQIRVLLQQLARRDRRIKDVMFEQHVSCGKVH